MPFIKGRLLTVPEDLLNTKNQQPIQVSNVTEGSTLADEVWSRPVSFHMMETGLYDNRRNRVEADYIASVIRGLLNKKRSIQ